MFYFLPMVTEAEIAKFQQLYKQHFGIDLPRDVALHKYIRLLRTVELTYKPMTQEELDNLETPVL